MPYVVDIVLRPTLEDDLDFVIELEREPDTSPFVGQWSREEHRAAIDALGREHWMIVSASGERLGYVILYDLRSVGHGVYIKRIAVGRKSIGIGRRALGEILRHAASDLEAEFVSLAVYRENARARRAYHATGFAVVELSDEELRTMREAVDPFPDKCLVMIARLG